MRRTKTSGADWWSSARHRDSMSSPNSLERWRFFQTLQRVFFLLKNDKIWHFSVWSLFGRPPVHLSLSATVCGQAHWLALLLLQEFTWKMKQKSSFWKLDKKSGVFKKIYIHNFQNCCPVWCLAPTVSPRSEEEESDSSTPCSPSLRRKADGILNQIGNLEKWLFSAMKERASQRNTFWVSESETRSR